MMKNGHFIQTVVSLFIILFCMHSEECPRAELSVDPMQNYLQLLEQYRKLAEKDRFYLMLPVAKKLNLSAKKSFGGKSTEHFEALYRLGQTYEQLGLFNKAIESCRQAYDICSELTKMGKDRCLYLNSCTATSLLREGRVVEAESILEELLAFFNKNGALGDHQTIACIRLLATAKSRQGKTDEALNLLSDAIKIVDHSTSQGMVEYTNLLTVLGACLSDDTRFEDGETLLLASLDLQRQNGISGHPHSSRALLELAKIHYEKGEMEICFREAARALRMIERSLGPDHYYVGVPFYVLGKVRYSQGRAGEATVFLEESLWRSRSICQGGNDQILKTLNLLGKIAESEKDWAWAEVLAEKLLTELECGPREHRELVPDALSKLDYITRQRRYEKQATDRASKSGRLYPFLSESQSVNLEEMKPSDHNSKN